jgi:hypothetical protein
LKPPLVLVALVLAVLRLAVLRLARSVLAVPAALHWLPWASRLLLVLAVRVVRPPPPPPPTEHWRLPGAKGFCSRRALARLLFFISCSAWLLI